MASFLTDAWFDAARGALSGLPPADAPDTIVQWVVSSAPGGKVNWFVVVRGGHVAELAAGKHADATCTVQCSYAVVRAMAEGTLASDVAFMRGDLKIDGDYAAYVLGLHALGCVEGFDAALAALAAATEF